MIRMAIKLIADRHGRDFLNDQSDYDHPRFQRLLTKLQEHNVRFVVASGNQYPHLPQYFTGLTGEITYLAEDGAHIVLDEQTISEDVIPQPLGDFLRWTRTQPFFNRPGFYFPADKQLGRKCWPLQSGLNSPVIFTVTWRTWWIWPR